MLLSTFSIHLFAQVEVPQKVGTWESVQGFTINQDEDYMVISFTIIGKNQLYETRLENGVWSEVQPIDIINKHHGDGYDIEGPSLNYNAKLLLFHANFPDSKGGFDIYYSKRGPNGWSEPVNIGSPINTKEDELYPSITPGEDRLFFSRRISDENIKKPKDSPQCQRIFASIKNIDNSWNVPLPLHDGINRGCEYSPNVCIDGKTVFFSSILPDQYREGYNIFFTSEILQDNWLVPLKVAEIASEATNINPTFVNGKIYFLRKWQARKQEFGSIFSMTLPENYHPNKTLPSKGKVLSQATGNPIDATLTVFEPTTLQVLGTFYSDAQTGEFELPLLDGSNYIVDVRRRGFSFASFMVDYRENDKKYAPEKIELFERIELVVSVYDSEIFKPIDAILTVENAVKKEQKFLGTAIEPGVYSFSLPLGNEYSVNASADWFGENSFNLNVSGDVIFRRFERSLPLEAKKRAFEIVIADSETEEGVAAEVLIRNLNRDETIVFSIEDVKNGKVTAMLREGDEYEFTIRGAQGYSFHNQVVDLGKQESSTLTAELVPLKAQTSIRLNNINFGTNSAELSSESFPELDRVITLLKDNPSIVIEIAAHTDNVGNAGYNLLLSEKRAQAVVRYLLDFEVPSERIVAKGYGLTKPMVPNTSDENRALNRRVEFKIIDILEEGTTEGV
ncbi:MAG TPA: OmpA family protein [Tenuifilaceae bacterium]|nr:OmpA family protein [Tenuifilaceae bacterium]